MSSPITFLDFSATASVCYFTIKKKQRGRERDGRKRQKEKEKTED
jgi:hypothetical protein